MNRECTQESLDQRFLNKSEKKNITEIVEGTLEQIFYSMTKARMEKHGLTIELF